MILNKKGFTLVEIIITITIATILIGFWASKLNLFFQKEKTFSNIDWIYRNVLKQKIDLNLNKNSWYIFFNNDVKNFYSFYSDPYKKNKSFYINSWEILDKKYLNVSFFSPYFLDFTWKLVIENNNEKVEEEIIFDSLGKSNIFTIELGKIENMLLYITKDSNILTWNLQIINNSWDNSLSILNIYWIDYSNKELQLKNIEIVNNNWIFKNYSLENNKKIQIKEFKITFWDKDKNSAFLSF